MIMDKRSKLMTEGRESGKLLLLFWFYLVYFQVEYHELETFNGDSSSISVVQPQFSMENLQVVKRMTTILLMTATITTAKTKLTMFSSAGS